MKVSCYKRGTATISKGEQLEGNKVNNYKRRRDIMREGVQFLRRVQNYKRKCKIIKEG